MNTVFGIETEYGILVEGQDPSDLVKEVIEVVRSCSRPSAHPWDYRGEDPRRDLRGYRVNHLTQNPEDARYEKPQTRPMTVQEERSDRILTNGARLYNDHGHPEYSTPECSTLRELVAHDRAGERIVLECARVRGESGPAVRIFKNNTDHHGMSYGCHENYLFPREMPFEALLLGMMPFLVTRPIFAGAGKVGAEVRSSPVPVFQLSQRADFFTVDASVDTLHQRPIFNTRDEPHADPRQYRRLHMICGDANLSEYATALKVGTTAVVLDLLRTGWSPPFAIRNPVATISALSRDQSWQWHLTLETGKTIRATNLQRVYLDAALDRLDADADTQWVLGEWGTVLAALERDPLVLSDRLDWVAKRSLLEQFLKEEDLDWTASIAPSLDLAYHDLDPENGLFYGLQEMGAMRRIVSDAEIAEAAVSPPMTTRAWLRGNIVRRFPHAVRAVSWSRISLELDEQSIVLDLGAPSLDPSLRDRLEQSEDLSDWAAAIGRTQT